MTELEYYKAYCEAFLKTLAEVITEKEREIKQLRMELNAHPCITNRPRKEAKNE